MTDSLDHPTTAIFPAAQRALEWAIVIAIVLLGLTLAPLWWGWLPPETGVILSIILTLLVVVYAAVRLRSGQLKRGERPSLGLTVGVAIVLVGGLAAVLVGLFNQPVGWLLWPAGMLLIAMAVGIPQRVRPHRAATVLAYLRQAVDLNLPLPAMLTAVARSERGMLRFRLKDLAHDLSAGHDVSSALRQSLPELTVREAALLDAADRAGRLPQTLDRLVRQKNSRNPGRFIDRSVLVAYPLGVVCVLGIIVLGVMVFIVPKFEKIFEDFQTELPAPTLLLINTARWLGGTLYPTQAIPGLFWVLLAGMIVHSLQVAVGRGARTGPLGFLLWYAPVWHGLERDAALGDVCHVLEEAVAAGVTPDRALETAAELPVNIMVRGRVRRWAQASSSGKTLAEGAKAAGLPTLVVGMLTAGQDSADLPAALGVLSRFYDYRLARTATVVQSAAMPVAVFILGAMVAMVVVGLFSPLVKLIYILTIPPWSGP